MPRKLTTAKFIEKATSVHGDRYDYSKVEYERSRAKVMIICPDHGLFEQTPNHHLMGQGCDGCSRITRGIALTSTTKEFVEKSIAAHGNRYDYSQVEYVDSKTKVTIICPAHGPFQQTPNNHIRKGPLGCMYCKRIALSRQKASTREEFIEIAKAVHGDRYDYSKVEYVNRHTKVTIICPEHGPFPQLPFNHVRQESGCRECGGTKPLTTETFIQKAVAAHGDHYDYSKVEYVDNKTKVTIICPDHGPFSQAPVTHIHREYGCPECGGTKPLTTETFIEKAIAAHGDHYDYSKVGYVDNKTKVTIICPDHGPFSQVPATHIHQESGCPDCAESGFNPNDRATLYYLVITTDIGDTRYKIGVTNRAVEERFRPVDLARIRIVKTWDYTIGRTAAEREAEILHQYAGDRYYGPDILKDGNTELFTHDVLGLDRHYK